MCEWTRSVSGDGKGNVSDNAEANVHDGMTIPGLSRAKNNNSADFDRDGLQVSKR